MMRFLVLTVIATCALANPIEREHRTYGQNDADHGMFHQQQRSESGMQLISSREEIKMADETANVEKENSIKDIQLSAESLLIQSPILEKDQPVAAVKEQLPVEVISPVEDIAPVEDLAPVEDISPVEEEVYKKKPGLIETPVDSESPAPTKKIVQASEPKLDEESVSREEEVVVENEEVAIANEQVAVEKEQDVIEEKIIPVKSVSIKEPIDSKEPIAAKETEVIEELVISKDPINVKESVAVEKNIAIEKPVDVEKAAAVQESVGLEKSVPIEQKIIVEEPIAVIEPVAVIKSAADATPNDVEKSIIDEDLAVIKEPIVAPVEEQLDAEEPIIIKKPIVVVEPAMVEEPLVVEELVAAEESSAVEEPVSIEEAAVVKSVAKDEPHSVEYLEPAEKKVPSGEPILREETLEAELRAETVENLKHIERVQAVDPLKTSESILVVKSDVKVIDTEKEIPTKKDAVSEEYSKKPIIDGEKNSKESGNVDTEDKVDIPKKVAIIAESNAPEISEEIIEIEADPAKVSTDDNIKEDSTIVADDIVKVKDSSDSISKTASGEVILKNKEISEESSNSDSEIVSKYVPRSSALNVVDESVAVEEQVVEKEIDAKASVDELVVDEKVTLVNDPKVTENKNNEVPSKDQEIEVAEKVEVVDENRYSSIPEEQQAVKVQSIEILEEEQEIETLSEKEQKINVVKTTAAEKVDSTAEKVIKTASSEEQKLVKESDIMSTAEENFNKDEETIGASARQDTNVITDQDSKDIVKDIKKIVTEEKIEEKKISESIDNSVIHDSKIVENKQIVSADENKQTENEEIPQKVADNQSGVAEDIKKNTEYQLKESKDALEPIEINQESVAVDQEVAEVSKIVKVTEVKEQPDSQNEQDIEPQIIVETVKQEELEPVIQELDEKEITEESNVDSVLPVIDNISAINKEKHISKGSVDEPAPAIDEPKESNINDVNTFKAVKVEETKNKVAVIENKVEETVEPEILDKVVEKDNSDILHDESIKETEEIIDNTKNDPIVRDSEDQLIDDNEKVQVDIALENKNSPLRSTLKQDVEIVEKLDNDLTSVIISDKEEEKSVIAPQSDSADPIIRTAEEKSSNEYDEKSNAEEVANKETKEEVVISQEVKPIEITNIEDIAKKDYSEKPKKTADIPIVKKDADNEKELDSNILDNSHLAKNEPVSENQQEITVVEDSLIETPSQIEDVVRDIAVQQISEPKVDNENEEIIEVIKVEEPEIPVQIVEVIEVEEPDIPVQMIDVIKVEEPEMPVQIEEVIHIAVEDKLGGETLKSKPEIIPEEPAIQVWDEAANEEEKIDQRDEISSNLENSPDTSSLEEKQKIIPKPVEQQTKKDNTEVGEITPAESEQVDIEAEPAVIREIYERDENKEAAEMIQKFIKQERKVFPRRRPVRITKHYRPIRPLHHVLPRPQKVQKFYRKPFYKTAQQLGLTPLTRRTFQQVYEQNKRFLRHRRA